MFKHLSRYLSALLLLTVVAPGLAATEYFVAPHGDDANSGSSLTQAFKTIQKGVDALSPGDTLTIAPGQYFEAVTRENLGSPEVVTTIRAQINGTVLLHGDIPAPVFAAMTGNELIFVADYAGPEIQAVNEIDTPWVLRSVPSMEELAFRTAAFYHDVDAGKLYITTSDLQPASNHHYSISVIPHHGFFLNYPQRVTVEGLVVRGFNCNSPLGFYPGSNGAWGIIMGRARDSVIRHCTAYVNGGGIAFNSGKTSEVDPKGNLIDHCSAYGNASRYAGTAGNILIFAGNHDEIRNSYAHSARLHGLRIYGAGIRGPVAIRDSLSWGNRGVDIFIKGGTADADSMSERNITLSNFQVKNLTHSLMGSNNVYNKDPSKDNIRYQEEAHAIRHQEFADPDNFDFRLQATSKFRNAGPDDQDRGPFPYQPNIYYITAQGKDSDDGLSIKHAWRTLAHAMKHIKAGDTLYLEPGVYQASNQPLNLAGDADSITAIRTRGYGQAIIKGKLTITPGSQLTLERIVFLNTLTLKEGSNVQIKNCRFAGADTSLHAHDIIGLRLSHNEFSGFKTAAIDATGSNGLFITANVFGNQQGTAVVVDGSQAITYSDYNAYVRPDTSISIAGQSSPALDGHPIDTRPVFEVVDQAPVLRNAHAFLARGIDGRNVGYHREYPDRQIHVTQPRVFSVTDTTANIEWASSVVGVATLKWGDTPACENTLKMVTTAAGTYSLTGLTPGKTYYFTIAEIEPDDKAEQQIYGTATIQQKPISFTTAAQASSPRTYHVAQDGDDSRDGLSESSAFATIKQAANVAQPGDTVLVHEGTYSEAVRIRNTGEQGKPITFKAVPGHRVTLDGNAGSLRNGFLIQGKAHINLDGFYYKSFQGMGHVYVLYSHHVNLSRQFLDARGKYIPSQAIGIYNSQHVTLSNSAMISAYRGTRINDSSDVTFRNNVFLRNYICCVIVRAPQGPNYFIRNIFMEGTMDKRKIWMLEMGGQTMHRQKENLYYMRLPDEEKKPIWYYGDAPQISLVEYKRIYGDDGLIDGKPYFQIEKDTPEEKKLDREGKPFEYAGDWIVNVRSLDFNDLFSTDPTLLEKGVGLEPEAFADFHFNQKQSAAKPAATGR